MVFERDTYKDLPLSIGLCFEQDCHMLVVGVAISHGVVAASAALLLVNLCCAASAWRWEGAQRLTLYARGRMPLRLLADGGAVPLVMVNMVPLRADVQRPHDQDIIMPATYGNAWMLNPLSLMAVLLSTRINEHQLSGMHASLACWHPLQV